MSENKSCDTTEGGFSSRHMLAGVCLQLRTLLIPLGTALYKHPVNIDQKDSSS